MTHTIPVIWSNDDITVGNHSQLQRQLAFIESLGLCGTFFVIPQSLDGRAIDGDVELCRTMETARSQGHEFYQHGFLHTPFESGVPEIWMLNFAPAVLERYDTERLAIEATHRLDAMVEKIEAGQAVWRRTFGDASPGYRPGWGAFCANLYRALEILGYAWVSSRICATKSWLWNQKLWECDPPFRDSLPGTPWVHGSLIEYPIAGDYGFTIEDDPIAIERMVSLFKSEFTEFHRRSWPMNIVSHFHGLERNGGTGYEIHRQAIPSIQQSGNAEFMGMDELHRRTREMLTVTKTPLENLCK